MRTITGNGRGPLRAVAAGLIALLLLVSTLATSISLHSTIHHDASQSEHLCAITVFAHGQLDSSVVGVVVANPVALRFVQPAASISILGSIIGNLPPGRAPPFSVSSQA